MMWKAGSLVALVTNLSLLGVTAVFHFRISGLVGFGAVLFSFATTLVIFVESTRNAPVTGSLPR